MDTEPRMATAGVLASARQLDALVAASLREAVGEADVVSRSMLERAEQLQRIAASLEPTPAGLSARAAIEAQVGELLRVGQYHDILGQAVERAILIQHRRAELVEALAERLQHEDDGTHGLQDNADQLLALCHGEHARHSPAAHAAQAAVELF